MSRVALFLSCCFTVLLGSWLILGMTRPNRTFMRSGKLCCSSPVIAVCVVIRIRRLVTAPRAKARPTSPRN